MGRHLLTTLALVLSLVCQAQTLTGSLASLKGQKRVKFEMEFLSIHGLSEEDFSDLEEDWEKDKKEIVAKFLSNANEGLGGELMLGSYFDSPVTVKAEVNNINEDGNYICDLVLIGKNGEEARIAGIMADGGRFGSKINLIGDGAEHTGKKFGKVLRKFLRQIK